METVNKHFFSDMGVMLERSMRHIFRSLDTIITVTIMPIMFMLLFVYVFGGAIQTGTDNYVNYLLPGILLMAISSGIAYTSYRLFMDMQRGIFERFHSMPIARSSVLWAHVLTSLAANLVSVAVIIAVGFLMCEQITRIDFQDLEIALPAFVLMVTVPFTYSISHGIGYGFITFVVIKVFSAKWQSVHPLMYATATGFAAYFIFG